MKRKYDLIVFDWAGTVIDYGCMAPVNAFYEAFKEYRIELTIEEIRKPMGMLKIDHVRTIFQMPRVTELWEKEHERTWNENDVKVVYERSESIIFEILKDFVDIKPYVLETINEIRNMGLSIGSTTGFTRDMMAIVTPIAKEKGYYADNLLTPDSVNSLGRPYPYMIYENMKYFKISGVDRVIKVGDTVSDIEEAKNAGVVSVGIIEGSSIMGLSFDEFNKLSETQKNIESERVRKVFERAGADYIVKDIRGVLDLLK